VQLGEWRIREEYRAQQHRDDMGFAALVTLQRPHHFSAVAVLRGQKVGANEQQDNMSCVEMNIDLLNGFLARADLSGMPGGDESTIFQVAEMILQLIAEVLVSPSIGEEDLDALSRKSSCSWLRGLF